tara:strand:- start:108 stop:722 length:615 start_codon:yes stop_codon:yes gene_type:complete
MDISRNLNPAGSGNSTYYYYSRFFGSAGTVDINSYLSTINSQYGYTIPFPGSLDALAINGFENALNPGVSSSQNYNFKISIGIWATNSSGGSTTTRYLSTYTVDASNVSLPTQLFNLTDAVFTRDQTMIANNSGNGLTPSDGSPTNWFSSSGEPVHWTGDTNLNRIGVVIKLENISNYQQIIKWENPTMGVQTFLKMDIPWNIQ